MPLRGLPLASPKLRCAPAPGLLRPELVRPTGRGNSDLGARGAPSAQRAGMGCGEAGGRWRTTLRATEREPEQEPGEGKVRELACCPLCAAAGRGVI